MPTSEPLCETQLSDLLPEPELVGRRLKQYEDELIGGI